MYTCQCISKPRRNRTTVHTMHCLVRKVLYNRYSTSSAHIPPGALIRIAYDLGIKEATVRAIASRCGYRSIYTKPVAICPQCGTFLPSGNKKKICHNCTWISFKNIG